MVLINTYFAPDVPNPVFVPLAPLLLESTEGYYGALSLSGDGVALLDPEPDAWLLEDGQPLPLSWDPPPEGARSEIKVVLSVDQHGTSPVSIECLFPDTGTAEIPASVVSDLINFGVSGFPNGSLIRETMDSTTAGDRCISFAVLSKAIPAVRVKGYIPCDEPGDCPNPLQCNMTLHLCE